MTWIKLEDDAVDHPKIAGLSDKAFRAWVRGLSYASRFLTDGALPVAFLVSVRRKVQDELIASGLWLIAVGGAVSIHDYLEHQRDKATIRKQRDNNKHRQSRFRNAVTNAVTNADVTQPEKSRADQLPPVAPQGGHSRKRMPKVREFPKATPEAEAEARETRRRRAEMVESGMTIDEAQAVLDRESDERRRA